MNVFSAFIGFVAGFGMQFAILLLDREGDQGDPSATTQLFGERISGWFDSFPLYVSGSSYVARYIGEEFSGGLMTVLSSGLVGLVLVGVGLLWRKKTIWAWLAGLSVHLVALLYVIDRFTLRYFVVVSLGLWMLAGIGIGGGLTYLANFFVKRSASRSTYVTDTPRSLLAFSSNFTQISKPLDIFLSGSLLVIALMLMWWTAGSTLIPFLQTGGSVNDFSLGDRTNSAAALVDERGLVECLRGAGPVHSENIHIWNRLQYVSHEYSDLEVLPEESGKEAQWIVHYRREDAPGGLAPGDLCPELVHFRVVEK